MPITDTTYYKTRAEILNDLMASMQALVPDVYLGPDGNLRLLFEVEAGQFEMIFLANQLLLEDLFVQSAHEYALRQHGIQHGMNFLPGSFADGELLFQGSEGGYIPIGTEAAYDPGGGLDPIYFTTTEDGTIPAPGAPPAPAVVVNVAAGNLNGLYEYGVTFVTAGGETALGEISDGVAPINQKVDLSAIPLGGPGTLARKIYRQKNGTGGFKLVATLNDNTTLVYLDNILDASVGTTPPSANLANRITLDATAREVGIVGNVAPGTITVLSNAPTMLTAVTNPAAFTGGDDPEDIEGFRARLLTKIRNPQTGSPADIKAWAEDVEGVESATVFNNNNLGVAANGHVTVRISAAGGAIPDAGLLAAVQDEVEAQNMAGVVIHVASFTPQVTAVSVTVTLDGTFTLADVTPTVQKAIQDYINQLEVGETLRISGIVDAVFGLAGIADVVVTAPGANQATAATDKRVPGTITVS